MAGLTFAVVGRGLGDQFTVRVVTSEAADSRIIRVVALAAGQAIGLETHIANPEIRLQNNFRPRPMTLPAKI